ncbi:MAG: alpha/beta hydrolase domain-containing protein [Chloroflexi bacterium]|nr:alpha/beta hydrolase domain-containing protein [Chloroflexota bacterium]
MPITNIEVNSRRPFADGKPFGNVGPYEQLDGVARFAIDPENSANETITDLNLAPRNADGMVTFSSDFRILQPVDLQKGNQRILMDIPNRGKPLALRNINSAPEVTPDAPMDPGNGFLMREGYTIVWCAWQHDVPDVPGMLKIDIPNAVTPDGPISGKVVVTFQLNSPSQIEFLSSRNHRPYKASDLDDPAAVLTVQEDEDAPERIIPRDKWSFARLENGKTVPDGSYVYLASGFEPGKVYQAIFTTTGAPVVGLGMLATRDLAAFLRYSTPDEGNQLTSNIEHAYSFGVSQSGRFLRLFLYLGLNWDEEGRKVFDGFMPHVAGGKMGEFNHRFAQPSSQATRSGNSLFPFSDIAQTDAETGLTDGLLSRLSARGALPKVMYTHTPSEYWAGHGSLMHTDLTASRDVDPPQDVRIYVFAGAQHALATFPPVDTDVDGHHGQHHFSIIDYRCLLRAALTNLDRWVTTGEAAPPSQHPRIDDGTAVPPKTIAGALAGIPGLKLPMPMRRFTRLDFGPDPSVPTKVPAEIGKVYPNLVSAVDKDVNERSGIALPFVTVPLATHTGWNLRHKDIGGGGQVLSTGGASGGTLRGSMVPFAATRAERESAGDPRLSIEERYSSKSQYLEKIAQAAGDLVAERYLLDEDVEVIMGQAGEHYDFLTGTKGS